MTAIDVCIVTFDSADDLAGCLESVEALTHRPLAVQVVDCASRDGSLAIARRFAAATSLPITVVALERNLGFAGGMNAALARGTAPWVLLLNPDARPAPDYLDRLLDASAAAGNGARGVGAATGRLSRLVAGGERPRLDACGMKLTLTWRHLDRGSGRPDRGQHRTRARVFGATGAASLFRREALEDVAIDGRVFDDWFHSFREDAELCFRLQERGWDVVYEPLAAAQHRRRVAPGRRRELEPEINFHSLKNRYLLRVYHQTPANLVATLPFTLFRDLVALGYVLLRERRSLSAYGWLWRNRHALYERRRRIQGRRTRSIEPWFVRAAVTDHRSSS
ncbi:MAG TPA: glycosyltransferase [Thermoanaerobaculia bacterium]|nr:glycosyltransferase [Thermoanaerobaculia bacterium]